MCHLEDNINKAGSLGKTLLMTASAAGWCHVVSFLLSRGAAVDTADERGTTALMQASSLGHRQIVRKLLEHNADVDATCLVQIIFVDDRNVIF